MTSKIDSESGAVIPEQGKWPVDPQEDQPLQDSRLWIDGCFDFFHHGHTGVMLQSRRLGSSLLVGLHSDEDIAANKGPTVMNLDERTLAVDVCRFSTKVVPHAPYVTSLKWISHYGCRYVTHGDDITSDASGEDCYRYVKRAGRMKIVPRTPGISTTDLVGRMLLCTKEHFIRSFMDALEGKEGKGSEAERKTRGEEMKTRIREYAAAENGRDPWVDVYNFAPKHRPIERRMSQVKPGEDVTKFQNYDHGKGSFTQLVEGVGPRPGQRVIYVDGGFDLFSSGHIAFLQQVTELESDSNAYVIAGIHTDEVVNYYKGINYPIMNLFERGLCLVQCRFVHAVVFSAPHSPSKSYLASLMEMYGREMVDVVYHGPTPGGGDDGGGDRYGDAKSLGIFTETGPHRFQEVNAEHIVRRILDKRHEYEERQRKKGEKGVGEEAVRRREELEGERERRARSVERKFGA